VLQKNPIEFRSDERATMQLIGIPPLDRDAAGRGDPHAVDAPAAAVDFFGHPKRTQSRQCARIERVAAQFLARERRSIAP